MGLLGFMKNLPAVNQFTGNFGEWLTKNFAKIASDGLILQDVLIDGSEGYTSQIDLLIIGGRGICVVEVKMFTDSKIYGDGTKSKWYYYKHGRKYEIYSPLKQNRKHIRYLKELLKDFGDIPCFSILTVICNEFKVTNINTTENIDTAICNSLPSMEKAMRYFAENNPVVLDDTKKKEIFEYIQSNQYAGKEARQKHKQNVIAYKQNLEQMERDKICPVCKTPLVLRNGKYGKFYGCQNYPKCKYTLK